MTISKRRSAPQPDDLEERLRRAQDRLRGRPETWWERNQYRWRWVRDLRAPECIMFAAAFGFGVLAVLQITELACLPFPSQFSFRSAMTEEEIMAARTPAGGWTKAKLAEWGVPWPPPHGWKKRLIGGQPKPKLDAETIKTLLDLLNPLHGSLDEQTYDEKVKQNFDAPPDTEYAVNVTAQQERDLTQAVCILENRLAAVVPNVCKEP